MWKPAALFVGALSLAAIPAPATLAQGQCEQCDLPPGCRGQGNAKPQKKGKVDCSPLEIDIQADIDFGRIVRVGDGVGRVVLDLESGSKIIFGELNDLGGVALNGEAMITGAPNQTVRVVIPTQVAMRDPAGGEAELRDFVTDLPALAALDSNGQLTFRFSATMYTDAATALGGNLRARIPISVQYD